MSFKIGNWVQYKDLRSDGDGWLLQIESIDDEFVYGQGKQMELPAIELCSIQVGDQVEDNGSKYRLIQPSSANSMIYSLRSCIKWKPKYGDWCWFYNTITHPPILSQFTTMYRKYYGCSNIGPGRKHTFSKCEPFIGELPSYLKDNQQDLN